MASRTRWRGGTATPKAWLAGVAVVYFVAQVYLVGDVPLGWDESVYASQTDPRRPALEFSAPRARGMSLVAAPIQLVTDSVLALRMWMAALSSLALYGAYAVWLAVRPDASVPLAAFLFTTLWTTLFYGPTTMPNIAVALAGVAATGCLLRAAAGEQQAWLSWVMGVAAGAAALVRPGDALPLLGALGTAVILHHPWRGATIRLLTPLVAGAGLGAVPWVVEAFLRYDNVFSRMRRAVASQSTGERFVPDYHLRALDGPILCRPCNPVTQPIPLSGVLWWAGALALAGVAIWAVRRIGRHGGPTGRPGPTVLPLFVAAALAAPYLLLVGYAAPRFLLPAYALAALGVAQGMVALAGRSAPSVRVAVVVALASLVVLHGVSQLRTFDRVAEDQVGSREDWVAIARVLDERGVRPPCTLVGGAGTPIAYVAGCDAVRVARLPGDEDYTVLDLQEAMVEQPTALVQRPGTPVPPYARGWARVPPAELPARGGFQIHIAPPSPAR